MVDNAECRRSYHATSPLKTVSLVAFETTIRWQDGMIDEGCGDTKWLREDSSGKLSCARGCCGSRVEVTVLLWKLGQRETHTVTFCRW